MSDAGSRASHDSPAAEQGPSLRDVMPVWTNVDPLDELQVALEDILPPWVVASAKPLDAAASPNFESRPDLQTIPWATLIAEQPPLVAPRPVDLRGSIAEVKQILESFLAKSGETPPPSETVSPGRTRPQLRAALESTNDGLPASSSRVADGPVSFQELIRRIREERREDEGGLRTRGLSES